jgi:uncharacterized protein
MSEVASPCINVCRMVDDLCVGCLRTLDEIARWSQASDDDKQAILTAAGRRTPPEAAQ